jgi:hypothetical protein
MPNRRFALVYFNDHRSRSFDQLRSIIVKARDLALRDAEREREAPLRRWSAGYWPSWKWSGQRRRRRMTTA